MTKTPHALAILAVLGGPLGSAALAQSPGEQAGIPSRPEELRFAAPSWRLPDPAPLRHELANGVPVYLATDRALPLVEVVVAMRAGADLDPPGRPGLASLTGALLRRGGAGASSADELDLAFDALAAEVGSSAGGNRGGATLDCLASVLPESLQLFFEMLRAPRFEAARLEAAKANLQESFARRNDDPLAVLGREWGWLLYGERHPESRQLAWPEVAALGREELVEFHRRHWCPRRMVVAVSGDVDAATLLPLLERGFAGWECPSQGRAAPSGSENAPPPPPHALAPGLYLVERDLPQAKIAFGHRGARRSGWDDPDAFALAVLNEVLGGSGAVSRLRARLRATEGLAYRAGSTFGVGAEWEGDFQVFLEVEGSQAGRAVALARAEVERLRRERVPAAELALAHKAILDTLPLLFDAPAEIAGRFAEDDLLGRPHSYWTTYRDRVRAVSAADLERVARRYLHPDRMVYLFAGRRAAAALVADLLGLPIQTLPERDPLTLSPR